MLKLLQPIFQAIQSYDSPKYLPYTGNFPEIITINFEPIQSYYGIAKIRILPPRGLYPAVLPSRSNGKLKYPLCKTCADLECKSVCTHSDEKRTLEGSWCIVDILKAIEKGYVMIKIIEIWHWQ
jgi:hypothetical protein